MYFQKNSDHNRTLFRDGREEKAFNSGTTIQ